MKLKTNLQFFASMDDVITAHADAQLRKALPLFLTN